MTDNGSRGAAGDDVTVVTDPHRMDLDKVYAWLAGTYWARGLPRDVFDRSVVSSLCLAALMPDGATCGFARVVSDRATFAYLCDVIVDPEVRGGGIGKALVAAALEHPDLQGLRRWILATRDAHGLYARFGFEPLAEPQRFMTLHDPDVYVRGAPAEPRALPGTSPFAA